MVGPTGAVVVVTGTDAGDDAGMVRAEQVEGWRLEVPASYDVLWTGTVVVLVALLLAALVVWVRTRQGSGARALGELLLIVLVPVLGPVVYLLGAWAERRRTLRVAAAAPR
jgi:hypothetical protein